ncbi:MAG: hypothetical protein LAT64_12505 [Phycisphaerales bacterium]|nr:DUF4139 domain-containing protein [Planctomycetota bacterium]MCH8509576.1 hypothetical protein [Phycisphaerales bacterium]
MRISRTTVIAMLAATGGLAATLQAGGTALTIYSTATPGAIPPELYRPTPGQSTAAGRWNRVPGYAMVRQDRTLEIERGVSTVSFQDVAALLDPTTVRFTSLSDPDGTRVLEQDYRFDLLSMDKMLERYIDRTIYFQGQEMTLMSVAGGGMLLQGRDGRIQFQEGYNGVVFPSLAEGLITRPTLIWTLASDRTGEQETRVTYQTSGITWWADYNLLFTPGADENSGTLDIGAWVSILNQSGGTYEDATLKLVAGDVHRAEPARPERMYDAAVAFRTRGQDEGFEQKAFFEYHLYTLGRPTTIPDRSTKQMELFETARGVPARKILLFDGLAGVRWFGNQPASDQNFGLNTDAKVAVYLKFENKEEHGMGIPLPSGRMRVNQTDEADGSEEFIGESVIDHTPRGEEVMIMLGNAFDVVGERRQVSFERGRNWITETIEVTLRNRKAEPVEVVVQERLYRWVNAEIQDISHRHEMLDARMFHVPVMLRPDEEEKVTYTVRYSW